MKQGREMAERVENVCLWGGWGICGEVNEPGPICWNSSSLPSPSAELDLEAGRGNPSAPLVGMWQELGRNSYFLAHSFNHLFSPTIESPSSLVSLKNSVEAFILPWVFSMPVFVCQGRALS